ncbi:MAG: hypothetical protein KDB53_16665 [Planctomycetes bacterium]|nr:hypothetical protein [Planctomycetota bacterium]
MNRVSWSCLAIVVMLGIASCASPSDAPLGDDPESLAAQALADSRFEEAGRLYRALAYSEDAPNYRILVGYALSQAWLGREDEFQFAALSAAGAAPWSPEAFERLGAMYVRAAERFRAGPGSRHYAQMGVEYLRRAFIKYPEMPRLLHNLGLGLHFAGDDAAAQFMLEEAFSRAPQRLDILETLLVVLRSTENQDRVRYWLTPLQERGELPEGWRETWEWAQSAVPASP